jgi:flagellar biosynthesis/type III secretory pathway protein FliH
LGRHQYRTLVLPRRRDKGLAEGKAEGLAEGKAIGLEKGIEKGIEKGRAEELRNIVLKSARSGFSTAQIQTITGLPAAKIEELLRQ